MSLALAAEAVRQELAYDVSGVIRVANAWAKVGQDVFRPRVYLYIDFLRPVMVDARFGAQNLIDQELARKKQVLAEAYIKFRNLFFTVVEPSWPSWTRPEFYFDPERQQDFINWVLNHLLIQGSVQRARVGTGRCTLTFEYNAPRDLLEDPFHSKLESYIDQLITPHVHMELWGIGRYQRDKVYPMFTGMTSGATLSRTGMRRFVIESEDYTKMLRISDVIVNPAFLAPELRKSDPRGLTLHGSVFYGKPAVNIISQMVQGTGRGTTFGGVLDYEVITSVADLKNALQTQCLNKTIFSQMGRKPQYKRKCFVWGVDANPYRVFTLSSFPIVRSQIRNRYELCRDVAQRLFAEFYCDAAGNLQFHPMRVSSLFLTSPVMQDAVVGTYKQRISISNNLPGLSNATNCSLDPAALQSGGGYAEKSTQWITRPKMGTVSLQRGNPRINPYIIPDKEIYDFTETTTDRELATSLTLYGDNTLVQLGLYAELAGLVGYRDNQRMMQQFGFRRKEIANPMMHFGGKIMGLFADAHFALINGEFTNANCTMAFRPEIDLAMPVAFPDQNKLGYINTITHSFHAGQDSMTSVGMSFLRKLSDTDAINFFDQMVVTNRSLARMSLKEIEDRFGKYMAKKQSTERQQAATPSGQPLGLPDSATRGQNS